MSPQTIAGRYELESRIGSGGMGTVWRGRDRVLDRLVAVKMLHDGLAADSSFAERFRREARAAAKLSHPNIVAVYDSADGSKGDVPYIVMEYVEGESLSKVLARQGPLPVADTVRIARSILAALAHAHARGLVHRDMKPGNILFDSDTGQTKVVDFGIAKGIEDSGGLTRTSGIIGTAAYLSPEQVSGREATPKSDLYAVGCLLYACLAGEPPFGGDTAVAVAMKHLQEQVPSLRSIRPDVPPALEAVVMRALAKEPSRRFPDASEMDAALAATGLENEPSTAPTVVTPRPAPAERRRTEVIPRTRTAAPSARFLAALTAFLLTVAAAALVVIYLQSRTSGVTPTPIPTTATQPQGAGTGSAPETKSSPSPTPAPTSAPPSSSGTPGPGFPDLPGLR